MLNNPLSYTDPSGYFFSKLWKAIKPVIGAVVVAVASIYCQACGSYFASSWYGAATAGAIAGGISAGVNGGNVFTGALRGAASAAAFYGIGSGFADTNTSFGSSGYYSKVLAHGVAGGIMNVLQGGKFGHGFAAAGVTQAFARSIDGIKAASRFSAARIAAAATVGGTISVITGGKFGNGAMTGAFSRMFNDEAHHQVRTKKDVLKAKTTEPEVVDIRSEKIYSKWIGDPPPGLRAGPDIAWRLVDESVYAEYEVEYVTTQAKTIQETVVTRWTESENGQVRLIGQRVTEKVLSIHFNTTINLRQTGIVGAFRLPEGAKIVSQLCITTKLRGC